MKLKTVTVILTVAMALSLISGCAGNGGAAAEAPAATGEATEAAAEEAPAESASEETAEEPAEETAEADAFEQPAARRPDGVSAAGHSSQA